MSLESYYSLISDLMSKERFEKEIENRREKYGDLLDDEAIAYLIVDEMGRNPGNKMKISDLYDGINATVEAKVTKIGKIENVKNHRILRVEIEDSSGVCQLILWNDEIENALKSLKVGENIKIINGYVKENRYGLQLSLGRWGILVFN